MFTLPPTETENVIHFIDNEHKVDKLCEWGLITESAKKKLIIKEFEYCAAGMELPSSCDIIGYIPYHNEPDSSDTAVIVIDGQLHKIMPAYLKEMQKGNAKPLDDNANEKQQTKTANKANSIVEHKGDFDFVAIDFETANAELNSACSIGIAAVNNNEIVEKKYYLIKPPMLKFDEINTRITGLTVKDVADEEDFSGIWDKIAPYIENNLVVAHNASFDMSVLKCCLEAYNLSIPNADYICSIAISEYAFAEKVGRSLAERTKLLGIELANAHNALADAVACAELVIKTLQSNKQHSLHKFISQKRSLKPKALLALKQMKVFGEKNNNKPNSNKYSRFKQISIAEIAATVDVIDTENQVYQKAFVFTGEMVQISREEAMQKVVNLGGVIKSGVSKKINYLVVGVQDTSLVGREGLSSKEIKAQELIDQGVDIQVINEQAFMALIGGNDCY